MNLVVLSGRLVKDLELLKTQSGVSYVRFNLAVNRDFTNEAGERETDFINCIAWRKQAENLARFMSKGSLIGIQGRIQTGSYESDKGRVYTTDIVVDKIEFLESKKQEQKQETRDEYFETPQESDLPF